MTKPAALPKLRMLKVSELKPPPGRPVDERRVGELAESMARVGQLAAINVVKSPKGMLIRLGLHRWLAARKLGWSEVRCEIDPQEKGPEGSAVNEEKVISENLIRLHMTPAERGDELAKLVRVRASRLGGGVPEKPNEMPRGTTVPTGGAGAGNRFKPTLQSRAIREVAKEKGLPEETVKKAVQRSEKRAAETTAPKIVEAPSAASGGVRDERGQEIPDHLVERWNLHRESTAKIGNLCRAIQTEIGKLAADANAEAWSQVQGAFREAWGRVRVSAPFAICAWCKGLKKDCKSCRGFGLQSELEQQNTPKELLPS